MYFSASISSQRNHLFAGNAALLRNLALKREPGMNAGAIRGDVDQRAIADLAQRSVLGDEHILVFLEGMLDLGEQLFRRFRLVLAMTIGNGPHEPARVLGFRRNAVEDPKPEASVAIVSFVSTLADVACAGKLQDAGRRDIFEFAPAI